MSQKNNKATSQVKTNFFGLDTKYIIGGIAGILLMIITIFAIKNIVPTVDLGELQPVPSTELAQNLKDNSYNDEAAGETPTVNQVIVCPGGETQKYCWWDVRPVKGRKRLTRVCATFSCMYSGKESRKGH